MTVFFESILNFLFTSPIVVLFAVPIPFYAIALFYRAFAQKERI